MRRGDQYTNIGGETVTIKYAEARGWVNQTTRLVVYGVDEQDAQDTLYLRAPEFRDFQQPEVVIRSQRLLEERLNVENKSNI